MSQLINSKRIDLPLHTFENRGSPWIDSLVNVVRQVFQRFLDIFEFHQDPLRLKSRSIEAIILSPKTKIFKNLQKGQREALAKRLIRTLDKPGAIEKMERLITRLDEGSQGLAKDAFKDEDLLDLCMIAYLEEKIEEEQLVTLFLHVSALDSKEVEEVDLFRSTGEPDPIAFDMVSFTSYRDEDLSPWLTELQIAQWFEEMKKRPKSEQKFLLIPYLPPLETIDLNLLNSALERTKKIDPLHIEKEKEWVVWSTHFNRVDQLIKIQRIMDVVKENGNSNLFYLYKDKQVIPTAGMIEGLIRVMNPEGKHIAPAYRLGCDLDPAVFEGGIQSQSREVSFGGLGITLPDKADNNLASCLEFTLHDLLYHVPTLNTIPIEAQEAYYQMGIFFKSAAKRYGENTVAYRIFSGLYLSLLDLDNKLFSFLDFDENESFWLFIFNTFLDLEIDEIMDLAKTQSGFIEYFTRINELQIFKNDIFPSVCKEAILLAFKNKERLENTNIFLDTFCMSEMGIIGDVVDQILSDRFTLNKVLSKEI